MSEVRVAVIHGFIDGWQLYAKQTGKAERDLFAGTGTTLDELPPPSKRVPWDFFTKFVENYAADLTDHELEDLLRCSMRHSTRLGGVNRLMAGLASPTAVYNLIYTWVGPSLYKNTSGRMQVYDDRSLGFQIELHDGYKPCHEFFRVCERSLVVCCGVIGCNDATIRRSVVTGTGLVAHVQPPPSPTLGARARRWLWNLSMGRSTDPIDLLDELVQSEEKSQSIEYGLRHLFNTIPDGIVVVAHGRIQKVNPAFAELSGYEQDQVYNMPMDQVFCSSVPLDGAEDAAGTVAEGKVKSKSGDLLDVEIRLGGSIKIDRRNGQVLVVRDLRELREIQARMIEQHRLATLGAVSAELSHEVASPLTVIASGANTLKQDADELSPDQIKTIDLISQQANHLSDVLASYNSLMAGKQADEVELDIMALVNESVTVSMLRARRRRVSLQIGQSCTGNILCRPFEIKQALINIINNAIDAAADTEKKYVVIDVQRDPKYLEVRVVDSGRIETDEIIEKFATPFYSTKADGIGLGFSIAKRAIERHSGSVELDPRGEATSVVIRLPLQSESESSRD